MHVGVDNTVFLQSVKWCVKTCKLPLFDYTVFKFKILSS